MKFCLIGIGNFGKNYIRTISKIENSEIISLCSQNFEKFEKIDTELKIGKWFDNYKDAIIYKDCDTVIIATHPDSHFEIAKFALENNKHVICEKPCMFSEQQFEIINSLLKEKKLIFYTNYINLFQPVFSEIKNLINKDNKWDWIEIHNSGNGPIREKYTALWDYGSHVFSIILSLFNIKEISINSAGLDNFGNHKILLLVNNKKIYLTFGNKSNQRINYIHFIKLNESIRWVDDKKNEPLKMMIKDFINNKLKSNIDLSRNIGKILNTIE